MTRTNIRSVWTGAILLGAALAAFPACASPGGSTGPRNAQSDSQGYLGVDLRDVSADQIAALKLKDAHGALIVLVDHDGPAGKAGLRERDVVLQMNGQLVAGQDQARRMLHECPAGRTVVLLISRDGQQITVTTQLSTREQVERQAWAQHLTVPEPQETAPPVESALPAQSAASQPSAALSPLHGSSFIGTILMNSTYTGAMLEQMSAQLADYFGASQSTGLLVRSVADNSPAALAGMRAGDVVVRANDRPIATTGDWSKVVKGSHGHPLSVVVLRDKKEQTLTLTPDAKHRSSVDSLFAAPERTLLARLNLSQH